MEGKIAQSTEHIKIAGLIFDKKLIWNTHIKKLEEKSQKRLVTIKVLSSPKWGADSKTLKNIYKSLVRLILDNRSPLYTTA